MNTIKGSISPSKDRHAPHDSPKLHHLNRRGEGKIEGYKCGGSRKRCSLLHSIHCENKRPNWTRSRGRAPVFRAFRTPFGPLPRIFTLSEGGRARCAATLGEVYSIASLCPGDNVSNKQISFWSSSEGTLGGRGVFFKKSPYQGTKKGTLLEKGRVGVTPMK